MRIAHPLFSVSCTDLNTRFAPNWVRCCLVLNTNRDLYFCLERVIVGRETITNTGMYMYIRMYYRFCAHNISLFWVFWLVHIFDRTPQCLSESAPEAVIRCSASGCHWPRGMLQLFRCRTDSVRAVAQRSSTLLGVQLVAINTTASLHRLQDGDVTSDVVISHLRGQFNVASFDFGKLS